MKEFKQFLTRKTRADGVNEKESTILAVAGKGGVGKTSIAAVMVKLLVKEYPNKKILAIDADPAVGLATALGVEVSLTIDDIRKNVVEAAEEGSAQQAVEMLGEARYQIFDALVEQEGFSFIAIGRPESAGCYCKINTYLKDVIGVLSNQFDYIVIDGEAGIEQINRRVMEKVTHLLLITDSSRKGTQVIQSIHQVATDLVMYEKIGVIANRLPDLSVLPFMNVGELPVLATITSDTNLAEFDLKGENVFFLSDDSKIVVGARTALENIGIMRG